MDYQLIIIKLGDGYMGSHYASLSTVVYNIIFSKIKKKMDWSFPLLKGFTLSILEGGQGSDPLVSLLWEELCIEMAEVGWPCCILSPNWGILK